MEEQETNEYKEEVVEAPVEEVSQSVEEPVEEPVEEKKKFVPRPGTKKEKAWKLFAEDKKISDIMLELGITKNTANTWRAVYKRNL